MAWSSRKACAHLSSSAPRWKHHVFLSFRSVDNREGLASNLCRELRRRGIKTFIHDQDTHESPSVLKAIKESWLAIVVLSPKYVSSSWCLEVLTKICQWIESKDRILPIFHHVDRVELHKTAKYKAAFTEHDQEKVKRWIDSLVQVASFSGWYTQKYKTQRKLIEDILKSVCSIVQQQAYSFSKSRVLSSAFSKPAPQWKYDVFLSFRGEDTRRGFVSHLYRELQNTRVIRTFKDDKKLEKGKDISQSLLTAIEASWFAIIVLSENYASSAWCLDELTLIFQCMEKKGTILPIFFGVDPSNVRHQKKSFEVAFLKHEKKYDREKVKQWRVSLTKVSHLSGWDSKNLKTESELIEDIVKFVCSKVPQAGPVLRIRRTHYSFFKKIGCCLLDQ